MQFILAGGRTYYLSYKKYQKSVIYIFEYRKEILVREVFWQLDVPLKSLSPVLYLVD